MPKTFAFLPLWFLLFLSAVPELFAQHSTERTGVGSPVTARCGDGASAWAMVSPPWPQPKSLAAAPHLILLAALKNGTTLAGLIKSEDATELVLNSPEDGIVKVSKAQIQARQRGLSAMPEGLAKMLSKQDLRDLIEYLAGLN